MEQNKEKEIVYVEKDIPNSLSLNELFIGDSYVNVLYGFVYRQNEVTKDYAIQPQDVSVTVNSITTTDLTLPRNIPNGKRLTITNLTTNNCTVTQGDVDNPINGTSYYILTNKYESITLEMTSIGWITL